MPPPEPGGAEVNSNRERDRIVLIGRDEDVSRLQAAITGGRLAPGALRLVRLEGPIGAGKTALLSRVLAEAPGRVLATRADRMFSSGPLAAARVLLESLLHESLARLVEGAGPAQLARACIQALGEEPVTIAVDDAQWLDPSSEEFFAAFLTAPARAPRVLVLAHRPHQEPAAVLRAARRAGASDEHLVVGALPETAIRTLAEGLPPHQARAVAASADGNPLFAHVLISAFQRHPEARDVSDVLDLARLGPGAGLAAAVADDIRSLPDSARTVLRGIAVLGRLDLPGLRAVTGLDPDPVRAALEVLQRHGLLAVTSTEALHPVIRAGVYQDIPRDWAVQAHRIAAAQPGLDPLERAEHLAFLREHASDDEVGELVTAARQALGAAPATARRWLEPASAHRRCPALELVLARAEMMCGDTARAIERLRSLATRSEHAGEARVLLAHGLRMSGKPDEASALLHDPGDENVDPALLMERVALASLVEEPVPEDLLVRLAAEGRRYTLAAAAFRTISLLVSGRVPLAREAFTGVLEGLHELPPEELRDVLDAAAAAVWSGYILDHTPAAIRLGTRALRTARHFGRTTLLANLGAALAFALIPAGRLEDADAAAEQAVEDAGRAGTADLIGMARTAQALSALWRRDESLMRLRLEQLREAPLPSVLWWRRTVLSSRARTAALVGEAEPYAFTPGPADGTAPLRYADAATISFLAGDPATGVRLAQEGLALADAGGLESQGALLRTTLGEALLRGGQDPATARSLLAQARESYEQLAMPYPARRAAAGQEEAERLVRDSAAGRLTPRELEVARLVAEGLSNQDIAERLVISRRTAEEHVSKVLRKLGASSRVAVARMLPQP